MWLGTKKMSMKLSVPQMLSTSSRFSSLKLSTWQSPVYPPPSRQNLKFREENHFNRSSFFLARSCELFDRPDHSHMITMSGDLSIVAFIPYRHYTYSLYTSIRAKFITASGGSTLSTLSTYTYSVQARDFAIDLFVNIYEPPVFPIETEIYPLEWWSLAPTLQTVAISPNSLRQTFFSTMLQVKLQGQKMKRRPFGPAMCPITIASSPMWEPMLRIVSPSFTNWAIALRFLGSQAPLFFMLAETRPSFESMITSTLSQMVDTIISLSESSNLFPHFQLMGLFSQSMVAFCVKLARKKIPKMIW